MSVALYRRTHRRGIVFPKDWDHCDSGVRAALQTTEPLSPAEFEYSKKVFNQPLFSSGRSSFVQLQDTEYRVLSKATQTIGFFVTCRSIEKIAECFRYSLRVKSRFHQMTTIYAYKISLCLNQFMSLCFCLNSLHFSFP